MISRKSSGYDTYVVQQWLLSEIALAGPNVQLDRNLVVALWASNHCLSIFSNAGRFLTDAERENAREAGLLYLRAYLALAEQNIALKRFRYRVRPKLHLFCHLILWDGWRNPHYFSTWMDEDALKQLMKTLRCTDRRTAEKRLLQRWLLAEPSNWQRAREK